VAKQTGNLIIDGFAMQPEHSTFSLPLLHHSRLVFMFRSAIDKIKPKKRDFFFVERISFRSFLCSLAGLLSALEKLRRQRYEKKSTRK
jgi:hypothetical protein